MIWVYMTDEEAYSLEEVIHCNQTKVVKASVVEVKRVKKSTRLARTELPESANVEKLTNVRIQTTYLNTKADMVDMAKN